MSWRSQADLWASHDFQFDFPADQATLFPSNLSGFDNVSFQLPKPMSSSAKPPIPREVNGMENSMRLKVEEPRLPKVPIPRATNQMDAVMPGRVKQACQSCREQKAKCSGHRPECRRCEENFFSCVYEDRKRLKMAKQLDNLANQVQTYESLLREIYPKLGFEIANSVDHVFGSKYRDHRPLEKDSLSSSKDPAHIFHEPDRQDGSDVSFPAVVAGCTTEDYDQKRENQAMGYVGDHSVMKWLYTLKCHLDDANRNSDVQDYPYDSFSRGNLSSVNYYLDDVKPWFPEDVDILRRPPQAIADQLVSAYFGVTHVYFPFIRKDIFLSQYRSFYSDQTAKPGRKWLAIFNLVLAIAGQSCAMSKESLPEFPENQKGNVHNTFFGRGWNLALTNSVLEPSNLQQVQVEALASLYLISAGHANRAWKLCGIAMRSAVMMGLHLRSESNMISPISKQSRYQLWWAIQMLDTKLCATIGRPLSMDIAFFTTPAPSPSGDMDPYEERSTPADFRMVSEDALASGDFSQSSHPTLFESPTYQALPLRRISHSETRGEPNSQKAVSKLTTSDSICFIYAIQLNHVMRQAIIGIYTTSARESGQHLESVIRSLNSSADHWLSCLPSTCRFLRTKAADPLDYHRTSLAFSFYCTKILILQPCLHIVTYQSSEKNLPNSFCASMAALCIRMAKETIDIFPDEPDTAWLFTSCPWWCALHYLMQSTAILMIALFKGTRIITTDALNVQLKLHKAVRWLRAMSPGDPVAQKASNLCQDILANHSVGAAAAQ